MTCNAFFTLCCKSVQSLFSKIPLVNNNDPNPTHIAPDLNQAVKLSSFGSTPPVIINLRSGKTGSIEETKPGPNTDPGKIFIISAPCSLAVTISVSVAQPGIQCLSFFLHT